MALFNGKRHIKDIILPKQKDKFNNRFGFLIVAQLTAAQELNTEFNGKWIGRSKLAMYLARDSYRQVQTLPSQKWMDRTIIEDRNNRKAFKGQSSALEVKSSMEIRDGKTVEGLVQQPSFCAVQGMITKQCQQILNRSFIGTTIETIKEDIL